jgi:transcriptional regulator with XRE-family HTH domain
MARLGIGQRVTQWRAIAGLSQEELGVRAGGYTKQYISAIETGRRAVNTRRLLADLAAGLGVEIHHLTGQPYDPTNDQDYLTYTVVPKVRAALDEPDEQVETRTGQQLEQAANQVMTARMSCDMAAIGQHLPDLLTETRQLWYGTGDRGAGMNLVKALVTGALALKAAGFIDLAIRMSEQGSQVADGLGDPIAIAATRFVAAQCALAAGNRKRSARLATLGADDMDRYARTSRLAPNLRNDAHAWMGLLHLHAALSDAGLDTGDAPGHYAAATAISRHVTGDPWYMEFGESALANAETWGVGIALESGQPERAPTLARRIDLSQLRTPQRRSRVHLDWGRGLFLLDDYPGATRQLLLADEAAPGDLRNRASAVEAVIHMIRHMRAGSEDLLALAVKVGVNADAVLAGD